MNFDELYKEVSYKTSRSSGAGGQNVNKVETKVIIYFNVKESVILTDKQKQLITKRLQNRISTNGILSMQCDRTRSQLKNKEIVLDRLAELLKEALIPAKKRKTSKPSKSAIQKRLINKKMKSLKKDSRRFNPNND